MIILGVLHTHKYGRDDNHLFSYWGFFCIDLLVDFSEFPGLHSDAVCLASTEAWDLNSVEEALDLNWAAILRPFSIRPIAIHTTRMVCAPMHDDMSTDSHVTSLIVLRPGFSLNLDFDEFNLLSNILKTRTCAKLDRRARHQA